MGYFEQIERFISQVETGELHTSHYRKDYSDLKVKVSFGFKTPAKIPWIAFLGGENTVQKGIYPQYIIVPERNMFLLTYGVSNKNTPNHSWHVSNAVTVKDYFKEQGYNIPGKSFIFKTYDLTKPLDKTQIEQDLNQLLEIYKELLVTQFQKSISQDKPFNYKIFHAQTQQAGLVFSEKLVARFIASLCTKPFVICSGLSGSGKTKLAQSFVKWICKSKEQYRIISVGADWTNREPLLGYPNGLDPENYVLPDSGALQIILEALKPKNAENPYFLILDEMNLSHVERYFADFLSIMESRDNIKLYGGKLRKANEEDVSQEIGWPKNLFIIGTVNIDETTYMFSPKVLDRANVIEFRISESDLKEFLNPANSQKLNLEKLVNGEQEGLGAAMSSSFLKLATESADHNINIKEILLLFFKELQKAGAEFGYRSASEINRLIALLHDLTQKDKKWSNLPIAEKHFIDIAIMQKLLPKLHGSRSKMGKVLPILGGFCVKNKSNVKEEYLEKTDSIDFETDENIVYKLSFEKICRMYKNAMENGYASYAEA